MKEEIYKFFKGEVFDDEAMLKAYSRDASLFEVRPKLVVWPKDKEDLENLVKWVSENKDSNPTLSITMRAAGSDMSGGPLGESIVADVTRHMNKIGEIEERGTVVEPGAFYRDFEKLTLNKGLILPCYPASKNLCALGGQIANNGAGEKTLRYGKMENFVVETKIIFADGKEYRVKAMSKDELDDKIYQGGFEGGVYEKLYELILKNYDVLQAAKPKVSKNSAGYYLWNVWKDGIFDLNKLIVGSQGTLGIITEAKIRLVPVEPISRLGVIFLKDLKPLTELVNAILATNPESLESFDRPSLLLAMRYLPKFLFRFIPEGLMILKHGLPELVVLVEYTGKTEEEVVSKLDALQNLVQKFNLPMRLAKSEAESEKYWAIRHESFNLLRSKVKGKHTAPFIDDVIVDPKYLPEFLPKMQAILKKYKLETTIAGHAGNGNFHIIPLMDMHDHSNVEKITQCANEVYSLVAEYHGSNTAEHNDGIVRTPYLNKMYSKEVLELFKKTKEIFDPKNIFNPGKKVGGTLDYMTSHIALE